VNNYYSAISAILDQPDQQGEVWTADELPADIPVGWRLGTPEKLVLQAKEVYDARVNHDVDKEKASPLILVFTPAGYALVEDLTATRTLRAVGAGRNIHIAICPAQGQEQEP
jgi:hypothetical protein